MRRFLYDMNTSSKKILLCLLSFGGLAVLSYFIVGWWGVPVSLVLSVALWVMYCSWDNSAKGKKIEEYIDFFVSENNVSDESYTLAQHFFFKGNMSDGFVYVSHSGISMRFSTSKTVPWNHIKGITLLTIEGVTVARLFLQKGDKEESKLFMQWDNSFAENVPQSVHFIDSRQTTR